MDGYAGQLASMRVGSADQELEAEFEVALADSSTLAFRVAFSVLRQREDAEDVAQEALIKAHRSFRKLRNRDRFRAWLVRITWRMAIDRRRSNQRRVAREIIHAREQPLTTPPDETGGRERITALWRAIDALPERLRVVIVLANIQEHDLEDVATLLRLPLGTVKSRLFSARAKLREMLS
jgi:RNA polymerase sigma-70 factor (ECF subfamily)